MADKGDYKNIEIDKLLKNYVENLPEKKHTDKERSKMSDSIINQTKDKLNYKPGKKPSTFEILSDNVKDIFSTPMITGFAHSYRIIVAALFLFASIVTIGFLVTDNDDDVKEETFTRDDGKIEKSSKPDEESLSAGRDQNTPKKDTKTKKESGQIDFLPLRMNSRAFTDTGQEKFIPNEELFLGFSKLIIETLGEKDIEIDFKNENKIVTEWMLVSLENNNYKARIIFEFVDSDHPGISIIEEKVRPFDNKADLSTVDLNELIKEIKNNYYKTE